MASVGLALLALVVVLGATGVLPLNAQKIGQNMTYVLVCVAVYAALLGFSHLWLATFRIGPLDLVLRSITEWRWVGLRRGRELAVAAAPSLAGAHNL